MTQNSHNLIVEGTTCFKEHRTRQISCNRCSCPHWLSAQDHLNCSIIAGENGPHTLEEIGQMFGVSRMRICQIEKNVKNRIKAVITR